MRIEVCSYLCCFFDTIIFGALKLDWIVFESFWLIVFNLDNALHRFPYLRYSIIYRTTKCSSANLYVLSDLVIDQMKIRQIFNSYLIN